MQPPRSNSINMNRHWRIQGHTLMPLAGALALLLSLACAATTNVAPDVSVTLVISRGAASPDCIVNQNALLVNGSFTGPVVTAWAGASLALTIVNRADADVSIHLHGLLQRASPAADGVARISSVPVPPGATGTFVTRIGADEMGTYYYHAHSGGLLEVSLYGALIVQSEAERSALALAGLDYDEERVLVLGDHWRDFNEEAVIAGLVTAPVFSFPPPPTAFLTNGRTIASPSLASANVSNCTFETVHVAANRTYRIRLIAATAQAALNFRIASHALTLIEADGTLLDGAVTVDAASGIELSSGQRYSVLLRTNKVSGDFVMQSTGRWRGGYPSNGLAVLRYDSDTRATDANQVFASAASLGPLPAEAPFWRFPALRPLITSAIPWSAPPSAADTAITVRGRQIAWGPNKTQKRWTGAQPHNSSLPSIMPGASALGNSPTLLQYAIDSSDDSVFASFPAAARPFVFRLGTVVDVVLQNTVALDGVCEAHPFHLHGHKFWIVDWGTGDAADASSFNSSARASQPLSRDTVTLYPTSVGANSGVRGVPGTACGWVRLRFVADNAGAWLLHCHLGFHMEMGMSLSLVVGSDELRRSRTIVPPPLPPSASLGTFAIAALATVLAAAVAALAWRLCLLYRNWKRASFDLDSSRIDLLPAVGSQAHEM